MKKTILKPIVLALATAVAQAIEIVDISTPATNATHSSAFITIPGICTNAPYTATNPVSVIIGDPLPNAFVKVNTNFYLLTLLVNTTSNSLASANTALAGQIGPINSALLATSNAVVATNALFAGQIGTLQSGFTAVTNQLASIQTNSDLSSATFLRLTSPSGTGYFLAVDDSGNLTVTNAP